MDYTAAEGNLRGGQTGDGIELCIRLGAALIRALVPCLHEPNCFVALPGNVRRDLFDHLPQLPLPLLLTPLAGDASAGSPCLVAWGGAASSDATLEVPRELAEGLQLRSGQRVKVRASPPLLPAIRCELQPVTPDDWELAEVHAAHLERQLLNQVGVLHLGGGQSWMPLWLPGGGKLRVRVTAIVAATGGVYAATLSRETEVCIAPHTRERGENTTAASSAPPGSGDGPVAAPGPVWLRSQVAPPWPGVGDLVGPTGEHLGTTTPCSVVYVSPQTAAACGLVDGRPVLIAVARGDTTGRTPSLPAMCHIGTTPTTVAADGHCLVPAPIIRALGLSPGMTVALLSPTGLHMPPTATGDAIAPPVLLLRPLVPPPRTGVVTGATVMDATEGGPTVAAAAAAASGGDAPPARALRQLMNAWIAAHAAAGTPLVVGSGAVIRLHPTPRVMTAAGGGITSPPLQGSPWLWSTSLHAADGRPWRPVVGGGGTETDAPPTPPPPPVSMWALVPGRPGVPPTACLLTTLPRVVALGPPMVATAGPSPADSITAGVMSWESPRAPGNTHWRLDDMLTRGPVAHAAAASWSRLCVLLSPTAGAARRRASLPAPGSLLLVGPPRCGKTALAAALANAAASGTAGAPATIVWMHCAALASLPLPSCVATLRACARRAAASAPSVLVLDDVDILAPSETPGGDAGSSSSASAVAACLSWVLESLSSGDLGRCARGAPGSWPHAWWPSGHAPVAVIATSRSPESVRGEVTAPGRCDATITLPLPGGGGDRASLLATAAATRRLVLPQDVTTAVGAACGGCDGGDLGALVDRSATHAVGRRLFGDDGDGGDDASPLRLGALDVAAGRVGFAPAAAWEGPGGAGLTAPPPTGVTPGAPPRGWASVGGLADVITALEDAVCWPAKHGRMMRDAPLRPRTGALLYGHPGCGKTHVAVAAAAEAGLRLVGIKGPELLNKYIGASEAAVRDLFARAAASAPCVLLFDELESIAPVRGRDSTGVTDRVVNALLTELDGVSSLTGVCVLGCTSRPDLVDPALLRPGRLDRSLCCGLPGETDRLAVLHIAAQHLRCDGGVADMLPRVAASTPGWTPADLHAILGEAHLLAARERLGDDGEGVVGVVGGGPLVVTATHVLSALAASRPSVPPAERARLDAIYARFAGGGGAGAGATGAGLRATLA